MKNKTFYQLHSYNNLKLRIIHLSYNHSLVIFILFLVDTLHFEPYLNHKKVHDWPVGKYLLRQGMKSAAIHSGHVAQFW